MFPKQILVSECPKQDDTQRFPRIKFFIIKFWTCTIPYTGTFQTPGNQSFNRKINNTA